MALAPGALGVIHVVSGHRQDPIPADPMMRPLRWMTKGAVWIGR
jgi:hypothetical protein